MAEWLKAHAWKACIRETVSWVRIPLPPPEASRCSYSPPGRRPRCFYDPFMGSGTTLIAAETIGRICLAMELEPRYVDVAVRRRQAFTGLKATLLSDGRLFEAIAAKR